MQSDKISVTDKISLLPIITKELGLFPPILGHLVFTFYSIYIYINRQSQERTYDNTFTRLNHFQILC